MIHKQRTPEHLLAVHLRLLSCAGQDACMAEFVTAVLGTPLYACLVPQLQQKTKKTSRFDHCAGHCLNVRPSVRPVHSICGNAMVATMKLPHGLSSHVVSVALSAKTESQERERSITAFTMFRRGAVRRGQTADRVRLQRGHTQPHYTCPSHSSYCFLSMR
jgi:hypothetical protein